MSPNRQNNPRWRITMLLAMLIIGGLVYYRARQPAEDDQSKEPSAFAEAYDYLTKGEVAMSENRPSEAEQHVRNTLALDPEQHQARTNLVYLLTLECRTDEALARRYELLRRDQWTIVTGCNSLFRSAFARTKATELHARLFPEMPLVTSEADPVLRLDRQKYPLPATNSSKWR